MRYSGNITGAFADGAVLFPLLVALVWQVGMDGSVLLATAGVAYLAAGFIFRVPMSVQPLKSVVVTALALGATAAEIRISGLAVGLVCLALSFCHADRLAAIVPRHLVHGLQLGLGVIFMVKGVSWGMEGLSDPVTSFVVFSVLGGAMVLVSARSSLPAMGWVATGGLVVAMAFAVFNDDIAPVLQSESRFRVDIIAALVLPQLALTLANSVVGTQDVSQRYFGATAKRVKASWLLRSIGIGNVISAGVAGLPFCHGAGGVTAHVKGGATSWHMNMIIGGALLLLASASWLYGMALIPAYPKILMAVLLFATGYFHLQLAAPSWKQPALRAGLALMVLMALASQNMLLVFAAGVAVEALRRVYVRNRSVKQVTST